MKEMMYNQFLDLGFKIQVGIILVYGEFVFVVIMFCKLYEYRDG